MCKRNISEFLQAAFKRKNPAGGSSSGGLSVTQPVRQPPTAAQLDSLGPIGQQPFFRSIFSRVPRGRSLFGE